MKTWHLLAVLLLVINPPLITLAAGGCPDGTTGNDNLTCSVSPPTLGNSDDQIDTDLGDDIIVQAAGVTTVDIDADGQAAPDFRGSGDGGNDTITNYGLVTSSIAGDFVTGRGGADNITNYGTIQRNIMADESQGAGGDDTITNAGIVEDTINGEGGNDTIINTDNGTGGADHNLLLDGGSGTDTLVFRYSSTTTYNQVNSALVGKSPSSGSITINGESFTWVNFEQIRNDPPSGGATPTPIPSNTPTLTATSQPTSVPSNTPTLTATSQPTSVPTNTAIPTQTTSTMVTIKISAAGDDVNELGASLYPGKTELWVGSRDRVNLLGLRFASLNIPKNAVITSAKLQFYSTAQQTSVINLTISGEATANSATFSTSRKPSQRTPLTNARLTYSASTPWSANTWYTLADVRPIVQEIIGLPAWQTGNPLTLILRANNTTINYNRARAYEGSSANAVRLVITYTQ